MCCFSLWQPLKIGGISPKIFSLHHPASGHATNYCTCPAYLAGKWPLKWARKRKIRYKKRRLDGELYGPWSTLCAIRSQHLKKPYRRFWFLKGLFSQLPTRALRNCGSTMVMVEIEIVVHFEFYFLFIFWFSLNSILFLWIRERSRTIRTHARTSIGVRVGIKRENRRRHAGINLLISSSYYQPSVAPWITTWVSHTIQHLFWEPHFHGLSIMGACVCRFIHGASHYI